MVRTVRYRGPTPRAGLGELWVAWLLDGAAN